MTYINVLLKKTKKKGFNDENWTRDSWITIPETWPLYHTASEYQMDKICKSRFSPKLLPIWPNGFAELLFESLSFSVQSFEFLIILLLDSEENKGYSDTVNTSPSTNNASTVL